MESGAVTIEDNDLFTGREVKRLLETARAQVRARAIRWLSLADAAEILKMKEDTLRKRCARWHQSDNPTVRVRKQTNARKSHWLLDEDDVWALARRAPNRDSWVVTVDSTVSAEDEREKLFDYWCDVVTRNL